MFDFNIAEVVAAPDNSNEVSYWDVYFTNGVLTQVLILFGDYIVANFNNDSSVALIGG